MAQAIAFNALLSIFPLVVLAISALAYVYGTEDAQRQTVAAIATFAPGLADVVAANLRLAVASRGFSGALGIVILAWSGKNLFMALEYALNRTLGLSHSRPLVGSIAMAFVVLPILGSMLILVTLLPVVVSFVVHYGGFPRAVVSSQLAGYAASSVVIFAVAFLFYTYLPNRRSSRTFGIPGAIVTTIGWELAQIAFAIYTTHVDFRIVYGAVGVAAILLVWFYYMGIVFLFGAQVSARWESGDELLPDLGAVVE